MKIDSSFSLDKKVAVVTGGASGIGEAIAKMLSEKGASVAILDLSELDPKSLLDTFGDQAISLTVDVTNPDSVTKAFDQVVKNFSSIDILVHSAGVVALDPAEKVNENDWSKQIDVNLSGTFFVNQACGKIMLEQGHGKIINMASQAGSIALDQHAAYCASKWGVIGLSKVLASEWAPRGVTVNTISPTVVMTELGKKAWSGSKGDEMKKLIPTGRFAEPEEIAAAAVFLASNGSDMINGADLIIDGGYTIQ